MSKKIKSRQYKNHEFEEGDCVSITKTGPVGTVIDRCPEDRADGYILIKFPGAPSVRSFWPTSGHSFYYRGHKSV